MFNGDARTKLTAITSDAELNGYAISAGAAVFKTWCAQCHGSGAAGAVGYPNLLDNDWLWGGSLEEIAYSVRHGIRNETDDEARFSQMPAFGDILEPEEIDTLVAFLPTIPQTGLTIFFANTPQNRIFLCVMLGSIPRRIYFARHIPASSGKKRDMLGSLEDFFCQYWIMNILSPLFGSGKREGLGHSTLGTILKHIV